VDILTWGLQFTGRGCVSGADDDDVTTQVPRDGKEAGTAREENGPKGAPFGMFSVPP